MNVLGIRKLRQIDFGVAQSHFLLNHTILILLLCIYLCEHKEIYTKEKYCGSYCCIAQRIDVFGIGGKQVYRPLNCQKNQQKVGAIQATGAAGRHNEHGRRTQYGRTPERKQLQSVSGIIHTEQRKGDTHHPGEENDYVDFFGKDAVIDVQIILQNQTEEDEE